jgi:hypothetical protein
MTLRALLVVVAVAMFAALPTAASASTPSDTGVSLASFNESEGCPPGIPGPVKSDAGSGRVLVGAVIHGPWGDFFGRTQNQVANSLKTWRIATSSKYVRIHERAWPAAQLVDARLIAAANAGQYYTLISAGSWFWRTVGGTNRFSEHAIGTAIDLNPAQNPYSRTNYLRTNMPSWFVDSFVDSGWCWGGQWVTVKDAMHYSWSGPGQTPGYPGRPAPYPPLTNPAPYNRTGFSGTVAVGVVPGAQYGMADFSGDGSADLYRIRPYGSGSRLEAAGSQSGFTVIGYRKDLPFTADDPILVADHDRNGKPDLWVVDDSGPTVRLTVWHYADGYESPTVITTGAPASDDYSITMHDDDWLPDLVTITRSGDTVARVWSAASGYATSTASYNPGVGQTADGWSLLIGDWDVNGLTDLYAVPDGTDVTVRVATQSGSLADVPTGVDIGGAAEVLISDFDGDGRDDLHVLSGSTISVALGGTSGSGSLSNWFIPDKPIPWDAGPECVGPEDCDRIGYVDENGEWFLIDEVASGADKTQFFYGKPRDVPFAGDWNCDGTDTPGLYRKSDGYVYLRDTNTQGIADLDYFFGNPGDTPIVGDFDGDGCDTVSIYRSSEQRFYIINHLGDGAAGLGAADFSFQFGNRGDTPFAGDFDGDDIDEVALHRASTGFVYLRNTLDTGIADKEFFYGNPRDVPIAGDWDGDGIDTVAVFRPSDGNWYLKLDNAQGIADHGIHFHSHDDVTLPVAGYFGTP